MKDQAIVLFRKLSKLEWDARRYQRDPSATISLYESQGIDPEKIIKSHERQWEAFRAVEDAVRTRFPKTLPTLDSGALIDGERNCKELIQQAEIVIACVGDELATSVAREMGHGKLLAINADPQTSEGALLWPSANTFLKHFDLFPEDLPVQLWPRIRVKINNRLLGDAIGDVFIGARERRQISRYSITIKEQPEEQQASSGLIVCTGAGSSGWYRSAYWKNFSQTFTIPAVGALFVLTEPYRGNLTTYHTTHGHLQPGEQIIVQSLMSDGVIAIDSHTTLRFDRDIEATITADKDSLLISTQNYQGRALKELFLGNRLRQLISRFVVKYPERTPEQQKSSGLLLATAAGAPDWLAPAAYTEASPHNHETIYPRQANHLKFIVTEPASKRYNLLRGELPDSESLKITSRMPEGGIVSLDSYHNGIFPSGSTVELQISDVPLKVLLPPS